MVQIDEDIKLVCILVCGGRNYNNQKFIYEILDTVRDDLGSPPIRIIHGGATGADTIAGQWAADNFVYCDVFPAKWDTYGKGAGFIRNKEMLDHLLLLEEEGAIPLVVAFPGGNGTAHMVNLAKTKGVRVARPGQ